MGEISECLYDKDSGQKVLMVQGYSDDRLKIAWNTVGDMEGGRREWGRGGQERRWGL